jgi:lysophospholipase L1-like esterase
MRFIFAALLVSFTIISFVHAKSNESNDWTITLKSSNPLEWEVNGADDVAWFSVRQNGRFFVDRDNKTPGLWNKHPNSKSSSTVEFVTLENKTSKALRSIPQSWSGQSIYSFKLNDKQIDAAKTEVIADVAVLGNIHTTWPLTNHVVFNGYAIGVSGDRITYGACDINRQTREFGFQKFDSRIKPDKWYQVKIVCLSQAAESVYEFYYREKGQLDWNKAASTFNDTVKTKELYVVSDNSSNPGVIGEISLQFEGLEHQIEDFEGYLTGSFIWEQIPKDKNVHKNGPFELVKKNNTTVISGKDVALFAGNNNFLIEAIDSTGSYKTFEFDIFKENNNLAEEQLSPFGFKRVIELSEGWQLSDLNISDEVPVAPSHQTPPVVSKKFNSVVVPGNWHQQFPSSYPDGLTRDQAFAKNYEYGGNPIKHYVDGWYKVNFDTPAKEFPDYRIKLKFKSAAYEAHVFINGHFVGMHKGSFSPFSFDATDYLKAMGKSNELLVWIYNDFGERPPRHAYGSMFSYGHNKGGLEGSVFLEIEPAITINNVRIDPNIYDKKVKISGYLNIQHNKIDYDDLMVKVFDGDVLPVKCNYKYSFSENGQLEIELDASNLEMWSLQNPKIYHLHIILAKSDKVKCNYVTRFGYRQFEVKEDRFYFNGEKVKLYYGNTFTGTSRCDRRNGYESFYFDLKRQRQLGCNSLRFHMATGDIDTILDVVDDTGMLLMHEFPIFHRVFHGIERLEDRLNYLKNVLPEQHEFIYRAYNHPSVVLWCLSNEMWNNNLKELYEQFYLQAAAIESGTRPICPMSGLNSFRMPDYPVLTDWFDDHNYDSYYLCPTLINKSIQKRKDDVISLYGKIDKPWIVSEFNSTREAEKANIILDPQASYLDEYLKYADVRQYQSLLRDVTLEEIASPGFYRRYMDSVAKRIYEIFVTDPVYQGLHPWYGDRGHLPEWFSNYTMPYKIMLNPTNWVVNWFSSEKVALDIVITNEITRPFNGKIRAIVSKVGDHEKLFSVGMDILVPESSEVNYERLEFIAPDSSGRYRLSISLLDENEILLNENYYNIIVLDREPKLTIGNDVKVGSIGSPDEKGELLSILGSPPKFSNINSKGELESVTHFIIFANSYNDEAVSKIGYRNLMDWINRGGKLLILEQEDSLNFSFLPGYKLVNDDKHANILADILVEHPALGGIQRDMFRNFNGFKNLVNYTVLTPLNENAILASGDSCILFDAKVGKGEIIISQVKASDRVEIDPIARKYMTNLLNYFLNQEISTCVQSMKILKVKTLAIPENLQWEKVSVKDHANAITTKPQGASVMGFLDLGALDFRHIPAGVHSFFGVPFEIIDPKQDVDVNNVIALGGSQALDLPREAGPIVINDQASHVAFLHTAMHCLPTHFLDYVINYKDGTKTSIPITGKKEIGDWYIPADCEESLVAWVKDHPVSGISLGFYIYVWKNPYPDKHIDSIQVRKVCENAVPIILAISYGKTALGNDNSYISQFVFEPAEIVTITNEKVKLAKEPPSGWRGGAVLRGVKTTGGTAAVGSLLAETLVIKYNDTILRIKEDYIVEPEWGSIGIGPNSVVTPSDEVEASYAFSLLRIDSIVEAKNGSRFIVKGISDLTTPEPPIVNNDNKRISNVLIPYKSDGRKIEMFPIEQKSNFKSFTSKGLIPNTLKKIELNEHVKIICWGDSVTNGGDASSHEKKFTKVFEKMLKTRFPNSNIAVEVIARSSTHSRQWLFPGQYEKLNSEEWFDKILAAQPDLVAIEFVNDSYITDEALFAETYNEIVNRFKVINAEIIFITPHFTRGMPKHKDNRKYVKFLTDFAQTNKIAIADVSSRWENLHLEGIPYITYLKNGYNHPDDRGHRIYAEELIKCFE